MEREWDSRLDALGVRVESPPDSQVRLVKARWVDPGEAGDKFYIFVRVQDEQGKPLQGQEFRVEFQADTLERRVDRTKGPGLDDFYGNFPMATGLVHTVDIPGMHLGQSDRFETGRAGKPGAQTRASTWFSSAAQQVVWPRSHRRSPIRARTAHRPWTRPLVRSCWRCWTRRKSRSTLPASCWRKRNDPQTASSSAFIGAQRFNMTTSPNGIDGSVRSRNSESARCSSVTMSAACVTTIP